MSLDFYDKFGNPNAYSDNGQTIYTFDGAPIAFLDGDSIYGFDGRHVGYFHNNAILDPSGNTLLFTDGAIGGPIKPMKQMKPMFSMGWSQLPPNEVFGS